MSYTRRPVRRCRFWPSLDAARRDHALNGEAIWRKTLARAADLRARLTAIETSVSLVEPTSLLVLSSTAQKVLIDISKLGVSGYAIDDWLHQQHRVSVGLSDARHLLAILSVGTTASDIRALA